MDNIKPLYDRILVKIGIPDEKTEGGIILPESSQEKPQQGEVVAVGEGKILDNGDARALAVKVGDAILFGKYSGTEIKLNGEELVVMREDDIMAVVE